MKIQRVQNNKLAFNGFIKFKNGKVINPDYIVSYVSKTKRSSLTPLQVFNMDLFMKKNLADNKCSLRYYNDITKQLDWFETYYNEMNLGREPNWDWYCGWVDRIKVNKLKMVTGDRFDFEYPKIVVPPHLSEITPVDGYKKLFEKMPEPSKLSTFEEILDEAKASDKTIYINANLD